MLQEARAAVAQAQAHLHLCQVQLTAAHKRERFLVEELEDPWTQLGKHLSQKNICLGSKVFHHYMTL